MLSLHTYGDSSTKERIPFTFASVNLQIKVPQALKPQHDIIKGSKFSKFCRISSVRLIAHLLKFTVHVLFILTLQIYMTLFSVGGRPLRHWTIIIEEWEKQLLYPFVNTARKQDSVFLKHTL